MKNGQNIRINSTPDEHETQLKKRPWYVRRHAREGPPRNRGVKLAVTGEEETILRRKARLSGLSVSLYLREQLPDHVLKSV